MKRLLIFLLVVAILAGAGYGAYRYLEASGQWSVLVDKIQSLLANIAQPPTQDDTDQPAPGTGEGDSDPTPEQQQPTPSPAPAPEEPPETPPYTGPGYDENGCLVAPDEALYALLYDAAIHFTEEVDIEHLGYAADELAQEVSRFFFTNPELFYVDNGYSIFTAQGDSTVKKMKLRYLCTPEQAQAQLEFYENTLDVIVAGIPANASDFDKVLYLHDYLVRNYAYDYEGLAEENATGESVAVRDAYQFFQGKVGVCQAYMLAMIALCEEVGIPCLPVTSEAMSHAWNLVQLDGEWYHVDVTWDDAGGEQSAVYPSYVSYKYFLLSGKSLFDGGRNVPWQASENADDDKYDDALWRDVTTPLCKSGEEYFCVIYDKEGKVPQIWRGTPTEMVVAATLDAKWYSGPMTYYQQAWASIVVWEEQVLVNTAKGFLYYDSQTNTLSEAADLSASLGNKQIFGIYDVTADGKIYFVAARDYKGTFEQFVWQISASA